MVVGDSSARLAVLIDAENAPLWAVEPLLAAIGRYGKAQVRRAYGDWATGSLKSWKKTLLDQSIRPVQVFAAVKGKNASDMALVIDAMDLLHSGAFDAFCLVSSDSDFSRLAERIREAGLTVHGFGEAQKANAGLRAACDTFVFVESLVASPAPASPAPASPALASPAPRDQAVVPAPVASSTHVPGPTAAAEHSVSGAAADTSQAATAKKKKKKAKITAVSPPARMPAAELRAEATLINRLREVVETNAGPDGWAPLSAVGLALRKRPAIILRTYGYSRLKDLMAATGLFEFQQRGEGKSGGVHTRVK